MPIAKLPTLLINQIAAGEVIARPASVVKELIENSLDAGASKVDIAIEEGGRQLIRIADDGYGIPEDELTLAIAPHATSKISHPEQLEAINTLGFRGEALASIVSVSRLRITSRAMVDGVVAESGAVLVACGDDIEPVAPAACAPGTVIEMRDLFFNTPARRKFMRAASTEFGHIADVVNRIAMVRNDVAFTLSHNGRKTLAVDVDTNPRRRCLDILGKEMDEALMEFESIETIQLGAPEQMPVRIWGLAGQPDISRATNRFQYLAINNRPVKDRSLSHAVKEAYRGLIPPDKNPVAVAFIEMDPARVDVNVHPAKTEVRFRDPNKIHGLILTALRQRLLGADLTPTINLDSSAPVIIPSPFVPPKPSAGHSPQAAETNTNAFVDYFKQMDPKQKGFVYQQVKQALVDENPEALLDETLDAVIPTAVVESAVKPIDILQIHQSYVVTQDEQGIVIVDQHALHERVMFEQLTQRITAGNLESQRLLMPATIDANQLRLDQLAALQPLLVRLGIEAEPIGPQTIAVHAFPSFLFEKKVEPESFIEELLDAAEDGRFDVGNPNAQEAALHEILDMMACKAAVKAGDHMTHEELTALLEQREKIERSSNCPHGRPTTIRLTMADLEKHFKRT